MKVLSPSRSAQVYFKVPETVDPLEAAKRAAGVSEFREIRVSARDQDGGHREFQASDRAGAPNARRQVADPDNVDPDFAPKTGMNSPSFFARDAPAPPTVGSAEAYAPRPRKTVIDPDNFDPDFGPSRPAGAGGGGGGGGGGVGGGYQAPKRKEIIDYDNIDPDFR